MNVGAGRILAVIDEEPRNATGSTKENGEHFGDDDDDSANNLVQKRFV